MNAPTTTNQPPGLGSLNFSKGQGLIPAIVQHADTGAVLMLGYMTRESIEATLERGRLVFFSRDRNRLWEKGESSGHCLKLKTMVPDCDRDALLIHAWPQGPTCHTGSASCFVAAPQSAAERLSVLTELESVIAERKASRPTGSYIAELLAGGKLRIAQKVGEEALEVAIASSGGTDTEVINESADLMFHLLVLLSARGLRFENVLATLRTRRTESASRGLPTSSIPC